MLPPDRKIKINFSVSRGLQTEESIVYKSRPFDQLLDMNIDKKDVLIKKIAFNGSNQLMETIGNEEKKKMIHLSFAFLYIDPLKSSVEDKVYDTYCNFTHTIAGGVHKDVVDECICRFFVPKVRASLSNKEKESMDIKWEDVRTGLRCVANLSTNAQVDFEGNMKESIGNKKLVEPLKEIVNNALENYFSEEQDQLKIILKLIKVNAKVRIESNKVRSKVAKEKIDKWNKHEIANFRDVEELQEDKDKPKELFLIEGEKSAMGTAFDGRDPGYQALYGFRGMTKNPYKDNLSRILDPKSGNREWYNYEKILDCGRGADFDIDKLKWDKIIIMTDADVDGSGIAQSICAYNMYVHPEIIEAGRFYKVLPPLYSIGTKKSLTYARDKLELIEKDFKAIAANMTFEAYEKPKPMSKSEVKEFLMDTINYLGDLIHVAKHYRVDKFFVERIIAFIARSFNTVTEDLDIENHMKDQHFRTNMIAFIQQWFPEIELVGTDSLRGIVNFHEQSIQITNRFIRNTIDLYEPIQKYNDILKVTDKNEEPEFLSIGQALSIGEKYRVDIQSRFKGLGEMDAEELWETTMNPDTRILVRLTSEDLEKEMEVFWKLNGGRKKDLEERKKLFRGRRLRKEELDN